MKADGKAEVTIKRALQILKYLSEKCNLNNSENTKLCLAHLKWSNTTKITASSILNGYYKFIGEEYEKPKYTKENKLPFIPTEQELDTLISNGFNRTATRLQILKETGARAGELDKLKWTDIDLKRKTIYITAEKGSNSRILPISEQLINMLNQIPKVNEYIFQVSTNNFRKTFETLRHRVAKKMNQPRLKTIHLHTFRHWKATMEQHKTQNIYHVKTILGHRSVKSTEMYIHIESQIFVNSSNEYISKVAQNAEQAQKLIDIGFEYVLTTPNQLMLFRKRK